MGAISSVDHSWWDCIRGPAPHDPTAPRPRPWQASAGDAARNTTTRGTIRGTTRGTIRGIISTLFRTPWFALSSDAGR